MGEVLDLRVLDLAVAQDEDPDLVLMKKLLRDHSIRPPWNAVQEESAEVKILWTQFHHLNVQENVLYRQRKETAANPQWQVVTQSLSDPRFSRPAIITPLLLTKE